VIIARCSFFFSLIIIVGPGIGLIICSSPMSAVAELP
jgi:hypothetical protein